MRRKMSQHSTITEFASKLNGDSSSQLFPNSRCMYDEKFVINV